MNDFSEERMASPTEEQLREMAADVAAPVEERPSDAAPTIDEHVLVSVVMPVYNASAYLAAALDSLLSQTLSDIEIICIDDGSTDGCLEILKEYRERDARVRIVTQNNAGQSRARNNGLRRARGVYVAFMDADDFCEADWLRIVYGLAERTHADVAVADYDLYRDSLGRFEAAVPSEQNAAFAPDRLVSRSDLPDVLFQLTDTYVCNKLFRHSFLIEKELSFPEDIALGEDAYFLATALSLSDRLCRTEAVLLHHRVYREQVKCRTFPKHHAQVIDMFVRLRAFLIGHGMYLPLTASYLHASVTRCYKIYGQLGMEDKRAFWNRLHDSVDSLGWGEGVLSAVRDTDAAEFAANVEVYTYEQYFPRLLRGVRLRLGRLRRARRTAGRRRRIKSFFSTLFGRKRKE